MIDRKLGALGGVIAGYVYRVADMEKEYWDRCPFHASGQCPQELAINRVSLIPQFVAPVEVEAARAVCEKCGQRLGEERKHVRTKRPLEVALFNGGLPPIQGDIIDISQVGALVKLKHWVDFTEGERVRLEIYPPHLTSRDRLADATHVVGLVKRVETKDGRLAMAFLEETDR